MGLKHFGDAKRKIFRQHQKDSRKDQMQVVWEGLEVSLPNDRRSIRNLLLPHDFYDGFHPESKVCRHHSQIFTNSFLTLANAVCFNAHLSSSRLARLTIAFRFALSFNALASQQELSGKIDMKRLAAKLQSASSPQVDKDLMLTV